jgi:predicted membrane protein
MFQNSNDLQRHTRNKQIFGIGIAILGVLLLLRTLDLFSFEFPVWPLILIAIGTLIGIKNRFRNHAWWILIAVGTANLIPQFEINGVESKHLVWPAALILGGLAVAFRPRKNNFCIDNNINSFTSTEGTLNVNVTFGGHKEIVTSKEFRGGRVNTTFGGCEINLMQADSSIQPMVLVINASFSGVEILVPSHWELQIEIEPSFGGVEDKRMMRTPNTGEEKRTLILRGTCSFSGIDIKSY